MLDIQGVKVKNIENMDGKTKVYVETSVSSHVCPSCKESTNHVHDYRIQIIQHFKVGDIAIQLVLKKRRYCCNHCGKKFTEKYSFVQRYFRKTNAVYDKIVSDAQHQKSLSVIAIDNNVSIPTVNRYIGYAVFLNNKSSITRFPTRIGIDEFKGNAGKDKYQLQIIDLDTGKIVDIVKSRKYDDLEEYFSKITNRKDVIVVAMDLYNPFKRIIKDKFPNAQIVADCFHYTRIVTSVLDKLRIEIQRNMSKEHRSYFKGIQKLLCMRYSNIKGNGTDRLQSAFDISPKLKEFHTIKESFFKINDCTDSKEKEKLFREWLFSTENYKYSEYSSCLKTLRAWHKYITNAFELGLSNARTEGTNNKIKVLKRISYGFRNFNNFRNRILISCS